ncbi:MAG: DEAD/DEAH box helicase, partial [Nanoarchaeota archaeon]|nr:DEAD/DEAH box helicase [Nanoarchaeota archaeon]
MMNKFEELGLGKEILATVKSLGFTEPTPIQEETIPLTLKGKDIIGQAATGSGKTLAFGTQAIMRAESGKGIQALVMAPTRELAEQVASEMRKFASGYDLKIVDIYGGVAINPQIRKLEEAEIVVGTPGRIIDHLTRRTMDLSHVKVLVLDEADRMVDMGFLPDVERIMQDLPKRRQTLLFSATMSPDIDYVSEKYMTHPKHVSVKSYVDSSKLKQVYYDVAMNEKFSLFLHLISHDKTKLAMVFCNTRANVEHVVDNLRKHKVNAVGIHGGMNQAKRSKTMEDFYKEHNRILVCTDVAARGLDIKGVTHVYNYDIPAKSNEYIHRIGRTARAGSEGEAISIVTSKDYDNFRRVLDDASLKIEHEEAPEFEKVFVQFSRREDRGFGGRDRGRGGGRYGAYSTGGPRRSGGGRYGSREGGHRRDGSGRRDERGDSRSRGGSYDK